MEITGGSPERTYVNGETLLATSARFGMLPNHCTAYVFIFSPSSRSATSVIPYQRTTPAPSTCPVPGHCRSSPADAGIIAVVSARCPPAEPPETTSLFVSKPYCFALRIPSQRAEAVFNRSGRQRDAGEPVFHVYDVPAHFHVRQQAEHLPFLLPSGPTA